MFTVGCKRRLVGVCGAWCGFRLHRKLFAAVLTVFLCLVTAVYIFSTAKSDLYREEMMEQRVGNIRIRLEFLESMQRMRQEDFIDLQNKALSARGNGTPHHFNFGSFTTTTGPDVLSLLKNMTGSRAATGMYPKHQLQRTSFVFQLMPHLMNDPYVLRPAYHMRSDRPSADVVIGIPTVKRDKESYLFRTIQSIIDGMTEAEASTTLITVYIGETDLEFVLNTARQLENKFPKHVENGLIEILSPSASFYPDLESLVPTLGDSLKRAKWRTKQNLDSMYLMAYAQSRGSFYLMLEDDVLATKGFMKDIKQFTAQVTVSTPDWFFIEYCAVGGIGKLFKSANLLHFITYMQLFYTNMPIDWLLESYLGDRVCSIHKTSKQCETSKTEIRPKYKKSLFKHIGLYSSLKGKIQKVNDLSLTNRALYFPHKNPPVAKLFTNLEVMSDNHSLKSAYEGRDFFWATKPKRGSVVEFWFEKPLLLDRYTFRSANLEHKNDKFYNTVVEVLPASGRNFTEVGEFDEFGLADDKISKDLGPLTAIRLKMLKDSQYWALLSEIELRPKSEDSR